jgi:hypothetical protein
MRCDLTLMTDKRRVRCDRVINKKVGMLRNVKQIVCNSVSTKQKRHRLKVALSWVVVVRLRFNKRP